ncbi:XRE family transcriptional regulator [Streptomyces sp. RB6PN25]|uniref:XRE family transcriptional regulator n=1 Tax=Streptomyces humicola TaxID=2953240 RepID=A0ABT1PQ07_9ACTN|nr:XRE family transcriptional regulator [Streptomyces humicola]MCQ4079773.1 XRE family transcriptional regulator [Streptomyces humicola]
MTETRPECARLAAELRLLRDRSGLSLAALAIESAYSKSSWQRYLAGRALPPWLAVRALCHLANEPEPPVRALWELAEATWSRRSAVAAPAVAVGATATAESLAPSTDAGFEGPACPAAVVTPTEPAPHPRRRWRPALALAAVVALLGIGLAAGAGNGGRQAHATPSVSGFHVACTGMSCNGRDPGTALCGVEPQTLLHVQTPAGAGLEIRYNPVCRAAWARVWNAPTGDVLAITVPGQPPQRVTVAHGRNLDPFVYTPLIAVLSSESQLRACLTATLDKPSACYSTASP